MVETRSGRDTSGIKKKSNARKTPQDSVAAAQRKDKLKSELESASKDLQAAESQLKNTHLTNDERAQLEDQRARFEKYIKEIEEDLMDLDGEDYRTPPNNASATEDVEDTSAKREPADGNKIDAEEDRSTSHFSSSEAGSGLAGKEHPQAKMDLDSDGSDDDDILVSMSSLSMADHLDGEAAAWFRVRNTQKVIVRYGPKQAAKYVIQSGKGCDTDGLQEVSDSESRIWSIMDRDGRGKKVHRYGPKNIKGIVGVVVEERASDSTSSRRPTTYINIKWVNIQPEDQHLCTNGTNWMPRADLVKMMNDERADLMIKQAWEGQENRYNNWLIGQNRGSPDRSPTPFPLDVFQRQKRQRSNPVKGEPSITVKTEQAPIPSIATAAPIAEPGSDTLRKNPENGNESNDKGTASPSVAGQRNAANRSDIEENKPESKQTFSKADYVQTMSESMGLGAMQTENLEKYVELTALMHAKYAIYKNFMLSNGAIEVE